MSQRDLVYVGQKLDMARKAVGKVRDPFQRRQLAVDLAVGIPPLLTLIALADNHQILLTLQN